MCYRRPVRFGVQLLHRHHSFQGKNKSQASNRKPGIVLNRLCRSRLPRILIGAFLVIVARRRPDRGNCAIVLSHYVITIDFPPFVTLRRLSQVIRAVIYFLAAIPVVVRNLGAFLPLIMLAIGTVIVVILGLRLIVVGVVLRKRWQAAKGQSHDR